MSVVCRNSACAEHGVIKENPADFSAEMIRCGTCGGPVAPVETSTG